MSDSKPPHLTALAVLPFAVMVIVTAVDFGAGPGVGYLPLVSLGPAFAGLIGGWRRTALIGATALLLCTASASTTSPTRNAASTPRWPRWPG